MTKLDRYSGKSLRIYLILLLSNFVTEWNMRPHSGKGSDRSDLVKKFQKRLQRRYKLIDRRGK